MRKYIAILIGLILAVLVWAPWSSEERAYLILKKDPNNILVCKNYTQTALELQKPANFDEIFSQGFFGKMANDCGRYWYLTFWGSVYIDD